MQPGTLAKQILKFLQYQLEHDTNKRIGKSTAISFFQVRNIQ